MAVDEMRIAQLAGRRRRIVTRAELAKAGMSASAIRHWLARRRLTRLHRGVYLVGPGPVDSEQREIAGVLACGPGAVLSHRSAARRWGLPVAPRDGVDVITATARRRRDGVRPHHCEIATADVRRHRGLRVTSPARTLLDLAGEARVGALERLVAEAVGTRVTTRRELHAAIDRHPRHRGAGALRAALEDDCGYTHEGAERRFLSLIRAAKLPVPETNVLLHGYEVDALWREERLIVEIDSFSLHSQRPKFERDRLRDADLLAFGYRTLRLTWRALDREPFAAIARVTRALAQPPLLR